MKLTLLILVLMSGLLCSPSVSAQNQCTCPKCNGEGMCDEDFARPCNFCDGGSNTCGSCNGDGRIPCYRCNETGVISMPCSKCGGSGSINGEPCGNCTNGEESQQCINCSGRGYFDCTNCHGEGSITCNMCGGAGEKVWRNTCPNCGGTGHIDCP